VQGNEHVASPVESEKEVHNAPFAIERDFASKEKEEEKKSEGKVLSNKREQISEKSYASHTKEHAQKARPGPNRKTRGKKRAEDT